MAALKRLNILVCMCEDGCSTSCMCEEHEQPCTVACCCEAKLRVGEDEDYCTNLGAIYPDDDEDNDSDV